MEIVIPEYGSLNIKHLVMDYNGTLAIDGLLVKGVAQILSELSEQLNLHVLTADTFGIAERSLKGIKCTLTVLPEKEQQAEKLSYIRFLGIEETVSIGNGRNDQLMLKASRLGIAVILKEGASVETIRSADIVCTSITDALKLLLNPLRLKATLRS